ncbi:amino acid ABC transporter permease [Campylobacter fetus]|uniref:amino acid ABC transporter permease n=1 Tax=Campylobacter fetus TaxID=196 RepID=UPI00288D2C51|nr:amino acid ABC transporter permease [Campylobacter fetus subsp. venerealis]
MDSLSPFALWKWEDTLAHWQMFASGLGFTLGVSILALILAGFIGVISGMMATGKIAILRYCSRIYVEVFQNTPLVIQLFFLYFALPPMGINLDVFTIGVLGIGAYHGAYMSEVVRSGINSIPKGQFEAAASQGFSYIEQMMYIILPQSIKIILPPATNQAVNLIKNSSVLLIIAGAELMYMSDSYASDSLNYATSYSVAGILYFIMCFPLAMWARNYEEKLKNAHLTRN